MNPTSNLETAPDSDALTVEMADIFNRDVLHGDGYVYTSNGRLSSLLANGRKCVATQKIASWRGRRVLDIGCGDGAYSFELWNQGKPSRLVALDPASEAIALAQQKQQIEGIEFRVGDAYNLPFEDNSFDIAHIRDVLHHMDFPEKALVEALRVCREVVVIEPNGYSPALKALEKISPYHRAHKEKSYAPHLLDCWLQAAGGQIEKRMWLGLVPMFAPDFLARTCKYFEPLLEATPALNRVGCASYAVLARKSAPQPR